MSIKAIKENILCEIKRYKNLLEYTEQNRNTEDDFIRLLGNGEIKDITDHWNLTDDNMIDIIIMEMKKDNFVENAFSHGYITKEEYYDNTLLDNVLTFVKCELYTFYTIGERIYVEYL